MTANKLHPLTFALRQGLAENANPVRAKGAQAYMKSEMPYRGLDSKTMRKLIHGAWKTHPIADHNELERVVLELWDGAEYREERYAAQETLYKYSKFLSTDDLPLIRHIIVTGAWWDHIDYIAKWTVGDLLERYPKIMKPELKRWIRDEHLWIRRTAILSQLGFKDKTDTKLLFSFCELCLEETSFWIRKSIGWALREYAKTDQDAVREFVVKHREQMSGLSFREATKHFEV